MLRRGLGKASTASSGALGNGPHVASFLQTLEASLGGDKHLTQPVQASRESILSGAFARASVAAVFRYKPAHQSQLQVLLIRRRVNPRDIWSGQMAFPGGKRKQLDATQWESCLDTARRETLEEVGLDLTPSSSRVKYLGELPNVPSHLRSLWVSTHVFLLDSSAQDPFFDAQIQESEIADVYWVDCTELFDVQRHHQLFWPIVDVIRPLKHFPRLVKWLQTVGLGHAIFPCVYLPRPNEPGASPASRRSETTTTTSMPTSTTSSWSASASASASELQHRHRHDFVLWGLTLRMLGEIFQRGGLQAPFPFDLTPTFSSKTLGKWAIRVYRHPIPFALAIGATVTTCGVLAVNALSRL